MPEDERGAASTGAWTALRRTRVRPTRRALLHLVLGVVLYAGGANVAAGWVVALAGLLLGVLPWAVVHAGRTAARVEVRRRLPARATAGTPTTVDVAVRAPTVATLVVHDDLAMAAGPVTEPRSGRWLSSQTALSRGVLTTAPVEVTVSDPFGLVEATAAGDVPARCTVQPPVSRRRLAMWTTAGGDDAESVTARTDGIDVSGVREYVAGESVRSVDWRSTARHRRLVVREFASPVRPQIRIVVAAGTWERDTLDRVAALVASVAAAADAEGHAVEIAADGTVVTWGAAALGHLAALPPHAGASARPLAASPHGGDVDVEVAATADGQVTLSSTAPGTDVITVPAAADDPAAWLESLWPSIVAVPR